MRVDMQPFDIYSHGRSDQCCRALTALLTGCPDRRPVTGGQCGTGLLPLTCRPPIPYLKGRCVVIYSPARAARRVPCCPLTHPTYPHHSPTYPLSLPRPAYGRISLARPAPRAPCVDALQDINYRGPAVA